MKRARAPSPMSEVALQRVQSSDSSTDTLPNVVDTQSSQPPRRSSREVVAKRKDVAGGGESSGEYYDSEDDFEDGSGKRNRFVWSAALHSLFEDAVCRLGVAKARPQAIQQLMSLGCEEEGSLPSRQNIKSHLQKYRQQAPKDQMQEPPTLKQQQRAAQLVAAGAQFNAATAELPSSMAHTRLPSFACVVPPASVVAPIASAPISVVKAVAKAGASSQALPAAVLGEAKPPPPPSVGNTADIATKLLHRQYLSTLAQVETHTKVHEVMRVQRHTQAMLARQLTASANNPAPTLSREQLTRLAEHVLVQRNLLQHLCRLLHTQHLDAAQFASSAASLFADAGVDIDAAAEAKAATAAATAAAAEGAEEHNGLCTNLASVRGGGLGGPRTVSEKTDVETSSELFDGSIAGSDGFDEVGQEQWGDDGPGLSFLLPTHSA